MIADPDKDGIFSKKLQSPPKPINSTKPSAEMQKYLDDMNSGKLKSQETLDKEEREKKMLEEGGKKRVTLFCNRCRRPSLKKLPNGYACGFCGTTTNCPIEMAEK